MPYGKAMEVLCLVLQLITGLTILNVWFRRSSQFTPFRGGEAQTLKEEFKVYGFNDKIFYLVGTLKVGSALGLLAGIILPVLILPSAVLLGLLMAGAIVMHLNVADPIRKSAPAFALLLGCLLMALTCEKDFWLQLLG